MRPATGVATAPAALDKNTPECAPPLQRRRAPGFSTGFSLPSAHALWRTRQCPRGIDGAGCPGAENDKARDAGLVVVAWKEAYYSGLPPSFQVTCTK
jgi:hypothetical protein